ncbi:hypothetical protein Y1Q_0011766 [Alligator mississippiensis]|uniref:Uncharacterized protein n=1 Tax=Alligator mississippiensis TaxID=8496 RepID=A0A151M112_ALLMI|nr:hypothetical protein Y1Q_0011766 [Alligator mississippiensis]
MRYYSIGAYSKVVPQTRSDQLGGTGKVQHVTVALFYCALLKLCSEVSSSFGAPVRMQVYRTCLSGCNTCWN